MFPGRREALDNICPGAKDQAVSLMIPLKNCLLPGMRLHCRAAGSAAETTYRKSPSGDLGFWILRRLSQPPYREPYLELKRFSVELPLTY